MFVLLPVTMRMEEERVVECQSTSAEEEEEEEEAQGRGRTDCHQLLHLCKAARE